MVREPAEKGGKGKLEFFTEDAESELHQWRQADQRGIDDQPINEGVGAALVEVSQGATNPVGGDGQPHKECCLCESPAGERAQGR